MPFGGLVTAGIGAGISGLAGLFGGGKQQTTKGSATTTANQTGTFNNNSSGTSQQQFGTQGATTNTQSTTQQLSPFQKQLASMFTSGYGNLFKQAQDVANPNGGYATGGLEQINQSNDAAKIISNNALASRGLSYSPAAATVASNIQGQRLGQESQFLNSLPMLSQQLQAQALQGATGAFSVLPTASTTSGSGTSTQAGNASGSTTGTQSGTQNVSSTGTTNQTGTVSGNPLGGLFGGLGAGFFGGGGGGGLGSILGNMFGGNGGVGTIDSAVGR